MVFYAIGRVALKHHSHWRLRGYSWTFSVSLVLYRQIGSHIAIILYLVTTVGLVPEIGDCIGNQFHAGKSARHALRYSYGSLAPLGASFVCFLSGLVGWKSFHPADVIGIVLEDDSFSLFLVSLFFIVHKSPLILTKTVSCYISVVRTVYVVNVVFWSSPDLTNGTMKFFPLFFSVWL